MRRAVIERLLCDFAVDLAPLGGLGAFAGAAEPLAALAADGLVETDADTVCVTPRGRPFARLAAQAFDAYRAAGAARHSRAGLTRERQTAQLPGVIVSVCNSYQVCI